MKTCRHSHRLAAPLALLAATLLAGCSSVAIYKVDPATGKLVEGAAEGARYYLPRPYVSVFEPFIVASEVYIARGQLTPDGNYVLLTQVPAGLDAIVHALLQKGDRQGLGAIAVDSTQVLARGEPVTGGPQSAPVGTPGALAAAAAAATPKEGAAKTDDKKPDPAKADERKPDAAKPAGGLFSYEVKNDNSAFAVTPQPRYFNILWLPDFDEQYVVMARPGLGNATSALTLGQGWNLQGVNIQVDNSALVKPILDSYAATLGALQKLAVARIEAPLALLSGGPQSAAAGPSAKAAFEGGTPVTVKVTRVRVVAPGLYPILKPGERAALSAEDEKRILAPRPPLTNIAFNTYDVLVIEAARSSGDSALRIQQYVDSTASGATTAGAAGGSDRSATAGDEFARATTALNAALSEPALVTQGGQFFQATLGRPATEVKVALRLRSGAAPGSRTALPTDTEIKALTIKTLAAQGLTVSADNVAITR